MYFSDDPQADLEAYVGSYLQQEIVAEGAARNVPAFSRFLRVAAESNGTIVNFTNVANDAQVARTTVYEYFEMLKDTLILHELPAWKKTVQRKPIASSKFHTAVELKAKKTISPADLKSLRALAEERRLKRHLCVSLEPGLRRVGGIAILPLERFLDELWSGEYS